MAAIVQEQSTDIPTVDSAKLVPTVASASFILEGRHKIFGPPGTGKTTRLIREVERLYQFNYAFDRIAYVSFTKAAVGEVQRRMEQAFPDIDRFNDLKWFRTIHSLAYRLTKTERDQMVGRHLKEFEARYADYPMDTSVDIDPEDWVPTEVDPTVDKLGKFLIGFWSWCRNCGHTPATGLSRFQSAGVDALDLTTVTRFVTLYEGWKIEHGYRDFEDLLQRVLDEGLRPSIDCLVVDEAQDLSPLQWRVVDAWADQCDTVILGGDDDQAIYGFQGADARLFLNQHGEAHILNHSYRLPEAIYQTAIRISDQITARAEKQFRPRGSGGAVISVDSLDEVDFSSDGSWFVLARNRYFLGSVVRELQRQALPYQNLRGPDPFRESVTKPLRSIYQLADGRITLSEWSDIVDLIPSRRDLLRYGCKAAIKRLCVEDGDRLVGLAGLGEYGAMPPLLQSLQSSDPLEHAKDVSADMRAYYAALIRRYGFGVFDQTPRIVVGTIHAVKGREADHVVLLTDMTKRTYEGYEVEPDSEHRVWYVGVTRARQSLTLVSGQGRYSYAL